MKKITAIIIAFLSISSVLVSCETYGDPDVGKTAVAPLDGRWICLLYEYGDYSSNQENGTPLEYAELWASNTSNNDADKMWHNLVFPLAPIAGPYADVLSIKIDCNPKSLTFSATQVESVTPPARVYHLQYFTAAPANQTSMVGWKATISDARVTLNGWETPSSEIFGEKYYADKIVYTLELDNAINGVSKFVVVGNRYTGWEEDYLYITDFVDNY